MVKMNSKTIKKYQKYSVPQLRQKATFVFNKFIRERDRNEEYFTCISCGKTKRITGNDYQAGHFYSGGNYPSMKFNEFNVSGQCKKCNYFLSGNLLEYKKNLIKKIGQKEVDKLDLLAEMSKRTIFKWDRLNLIEIIEKYKL